MNNTFDVPKYVYLDYSQHKDYITIWGRIQHDLIQSFGEPSDPRDRSLTARWCEGLMTVTTEMPGRPSVPKGIYFRDRDDLMVFLLKYPSSHVR